MAEVKQALTYLEMLVAPSTEPTEPANQRQNFDRLLQRNLDRLQSVLDKESAEIRPLATSVQAGEDVRWVYVEWLLRLLNHLHDVLRAAVEAAKLIPPSEPLTPGRAPPLAPDTLSLGQQKTLRTCLQFITFLGLCPHLSPGVGLPPERRSGFSSALGESPSFSPKDRLNRLAVCTETLLHCARLPALGSLIFSRHLGDLLAALAEIGHSPSSAQLDQSAPVPGGRTHFRQELDRLLDQVYLPAVVRELLLLQGSPQKGGPLPCAPAWLRALCGHLLSLCVMKPNGVQLTLRGILQPTQAKGDPDWKRCDAAAQVIARCPRTSVSPVQYYSRVGPQVLDLLFTQDVLVAGQFTRVAVSIVVAVATMHPQLARQHLLLPLLHPLLCCSSDRDLPPNSAHPVIVCEASLARCIEGLHKLASVGDVPCPLLLQHLRSCAHPLFLLLCSAGVSHLRALAESLLISLLRHSPLDAALEAARHMIYGHSLPSPGCLLMHQRLVYAPGESGGLCVVTGVGHTWLSDWETQAQKMVALLKMTGRDELSAEFFLSLLQHLTSVISEATQSSWMSSAEKVAMETIHRNLLTLTLVANVCEQIGPTSCLKNFMHVLQFIQVTLERAVFILKNTSDEEFGAFETETISMALLLLTSVLDDHDKVTAEERSKTKDLLPLLDDISKSHGEQSIRQMAADLRVAVATHGRVRSETLKEAAPEEARPKKGELEQALEELADPLVPVRGHGLIVVRRLLERRDMDTLGRAAELLPLLRKSLAHDDSYIFLAAVQALAALAEAQPPLVLPILMEEYASPDPSSPELKLKLGEVLMKTTRALGALVPAHRDQLLRCVMAVARSSDSQVRASAISNLGEVCRLLHFSLGPVLHEVLECISSLLKGDPAEDVRKAAALVITLLLQGLGQDTLKVLEEAMRDLYRLLKHAMQTEKSDGVRMHVTLALNELQEVMSHFLFPEQTLSKHIHVLQAPDS